MTKQMEDLTRSPQGAVEQVRAAGARENLSRALPLVRSRDGGRGGDPGPLKEPAQRKKEVPWLPLCSRSRLNVC